MSTNPTYFNTVQELNDFLREVLIDNTILHTDRHLNCGQTKYISLKRSPTDKFLRSLKCEDLSCPPCRSDIVGKHTHKILDYISTQSCPPIRTLLITLKLSHSTQHPFKYLYDGIKSSISHMKNSYGWRKLKTDLKHRFHFDRIETKVSPHTGFNVHCHQVFGCDDNSIPLTDLKPRIHSLWSKSLSHNKLRPVSPQYGIDIKEGDGFETYGLKQEQNQKMMESLKLKIEERFKPKRIKSTVMTKLSMSLRHEVSQMDYRSEDKRFKGNYKPENSITYSIGQLEGELMMYNLFPDYINPDFSREGIVKILKQIQETQRNHFYTKIYK